MKKIIIITAAKNEADIIESFCRYNLSYSDGILIYENYKSSDNTREIINKLIEEGLPIYFEAEKEDVYYEEAKGLLVKAAVDKHKADIIIQLDADEFLCRKDGGNPRETLEMLKEDVEYQMPWRTYAYERESKQNCGFVPAGFTHYRNPEFETAQGHAGKTIASRHLIKTKSAKFVHGGHWLDYPEKHKSDAKIEVSEELICAHYPIRSKKQVLSKAIPNYINKWIQPLQCRPTKDALVAFQLGLLFDDIKKHGDVTADTMHKISIEYSLYNGFANKKRIGELLRNLGRNLTIEGGIDTSFCSDKLKMQYTKSIDKSDIAFMKATLSVTDDALQHLDNESRTKTNQNNELTNRYNDLLHHYNMAITQRDDLSRQNAELTQLLNTFEAQAEQLLVRYG